MSLDQNQNLSPIPLHFFEPQSEEKTPCRISYLKQNIQNNIIRTLTVDCSSCPKKQCGLHEFACAYYLAKEPLTDPSIQSLIIGGKSVQSIYHARQLERIRHLLRIYKKAKLEPVQENETVACKICHEYLSSLFRTLKIMVISDPGMLYRNKEFYKNYAKQLCPTCSTNLTLFIDLFESEVGLRDPQWCKEVHASSAFRVDYYSSITEKKKTESTILSETSHLQVLKEKKVNGYTVQIATEPFTLGDTSNIDLAELFPISKEGFEFNRRQKVYVIKNSTSDILQKIISTTYSLIINDAEIQSTLMFSLQSNEARSLISSKIKQILGSVLEDLGIDSQSITDDDKIIIENKIIENTVGWGVWETFLHDDHVNEITAVAGSPIIVETYQDGKCKTNVIPSEEEYNRFVRLLNVNIRTADFYNRVLETVIDPEKHEIHFGRMRLTLFDNPLVDKKAFIIRKHRKMQLSGAEILKFGTMSPAQLAYCTAIKRRNKSTVTYVGDVGSGKSTIQFIIDTKIPIDSTVITVGDIVELDITEMGFQNVTLYADRPGEEKIGQSRSSLIGKTLRMKSDADQFTEVITAEDTAAWIHTWVSGKAGTVTYHAASIEKMLIRCADELIITGTSDPSTKMTVFQNVVSSRRILSTEGYKYRVVEIAWILDDKNPANNLLIPKSIFKWDSDTDQHVFDPEAFTAIYHSDKFKDVLYSVDTVKHHEFPQEIATYEQLWHSLLNCISIYQDLGLFDHIALGTIPHFKREIRLFTDIYDAQINMYKKNKKTNWGLLSVLGKRRIYADLLETVNILCPENTEKAIELIQKYENISPAPEFAREFLLKTHDVNQMEVYNV